MNNQKLFKDWLWARKEALLEYAKAHGITGRTDDDTDYDSVMFRIMETYGRIQAKEVARQMGVFFNDHSLESKIDGDIFSGICIDVEVKARCYPKEAFATWAIDVEKYDELSTRHGWLLYLWVNIDNPIEADWAIWDVSATPPIDEPVTCRESVARREAPMRNKVMKAWKLEDAKFSGTIGGQASGDSRIFA